MASASPPRPEQLLVLVVEDEPLLRMHAVELLEDAGFATIEASSSAHAIDLLQTRPEIRIVFTDVDMPGSMNGLKLAEAIRSRWPPIEIIITSGMMTPQDDEMPVRGVFFPKPYRDSRLVDTVRDFAARLS